MPFVVLQTSQYEKLTPEKLKEIEKICKDAWVSMAEYQSGSGIGPYTREDVGGVAISRSLNAVQLLLFIYSDRGDEFHRDLTHSLRRRKDLLHTKLQIELVRTEHDMWFTNPLWAIAPCDKPHLERRAPF